MSCAEKLAAVIETSLLGVEPDSQDVVLEDDDWRVILASLRSTPKPEAEREGLVEAERDAFIRLLDAADRFNGVISVRDKLASPYQGKMILAVKHAYRTLGIPRTEKQEPLTPQQAEQPSDVVEALTTAAKQFDALEQSFNWRAGEEQAGDIDSGGWKAKADEVREMAAECRAAALTTPTQPADALLREALTMLKRAQKSDWSWQFAETLVARIDAHLASAGEG